MFWNRWNSRDSDLAREIRDHLDLEAAEIRDSGASGKEAEYAARRALGNATLVREDVRSIWISPVLDRLLQDIRHAIRIAAKNPGFSVVAILSLALGIGANTAIFTFVNAAYLRPLPYPDASRIVVVRQRPLGSSATTPVHPRSFVRWQDRAQSFDALGLAQAVPMNTEGVEGAEQVPGLWVSPGLFKVFGVSPSLGRDFTSDAGLGRIDVREGRASEVILSHGYWQRRFGADSSMVGKTIASGTGSAVVVGVMPAGFRVANLNVDVYSPMRIDRNRPEAIGSRSFLCFAHLRDGSTVESANAEMTVLATQIGAEDPGEKEFGATVLSLRDYLIGENRAPLLILAGIVGFVLLIACANLAGLLLTRGVGRQSEMALRAALGAGRGRLIQQLSVESLVLSLLGGALGLWIGWASSRALVSVSAGAVDFGQMSGVGLDVRVLVFTVALSCLTALLFGLLPAWQVARIDLQSSVKAHSRGTIGGGQHLRSALVVGEVTLAVVLLVGAGLLLHTFYNLANVRLGFRPENVVTMRTLVTGNPAFRANLVDTILERVESLPGVAAVGTIQFLPLTGFTNQGPFHFVGRPLPADPSTVESDVSTVSRGYFAAIGMEVLRGRPFGREDRMDTPRVAVVNRSFVEKYSPEEDPLGRIIVGDWSNPKPTQIVGVVNDIRHTGLTSEPRPTVFLAQSQVPGYFTNLVVRTQSDPAILAASIRREVRKVDPRQPLTDVQRMTDYVSASLARPHLYASLVAVFASLALFLAAIGLYGLIAYSVTQRTHEIGLRMALGAQPSQVLTSTLWKGLRLVLLGRALGTLSAAALSQVISRLLYGVKTIDPLTYSSVAGLLAIVAMVATWIPARRAAAIDPIVALRYE